MLSEEWARKHVRRWQSVLIVAIALIVAGSLVFLHPDAWVNWTDRISLSTVEREPMTMEVNLSTEYFTDEQGDFFKDRQTLEKGLKEFYAKTGVRPYIYVPPKDSLSSSESSADHAYLLCRSKFDDEPLLFLTCLVTPHERTLYRYVGNGAEAVMDAEACNILAQYIYLYSRDPLMSNDEIYSKAFADTADRIMSKTPDPTVPILVGIGAIFVTVAVILVIRKLRWDKQTSEQEKSRRLRRFLKKTPLRRFADTELDELEKKYQ